MSVRTPDLEAVEVAVSRRVPAGHAPDADGVRHRERVEASRRLILETLGDTEDVTLVRGVGNVGDELIGAGTRALLAGRPYREVALRDAARVRGRLALLGGGGAWCEPYHELMPDVLPVLERAFDRVVVLPSSFDLSVEPVARALSRTRAVVFAREPESYRQIQAVCDARLAHDASLFFDFTRWRQPGRGVLNAFRTDRESSGRHALPADNVDISVTCESLDEWLWTIARHELVRTDRAHVLIAGVLLGKPVEYRASSYHKVPEIAAHSLAGFPVLRIDDPDPGRRPARPSMSAPPPGIQDVRSRMARASAASLARLSRADTAGEPRVTVALVSWNRPDRIGTVLRSVKESARFPVRIVIVDNASSESTRERLRAEVDGDPRAELVLLGSRASCARNRALAVERATTEFVLFLDDDAEIFPGTLEILIHALDSHPDALAAAANVVLPDGTTQICGGDFSVRDGVVFFTPMGAGHPFDSAALGGSGLCRWASGACVLTRRSAFERFPLDPGMESYYEDNEWGFRVERAVPGAQLRCPEALALHHHVPKDRQGSAPSDLAHAIRFAEPIAHFYRMHGLVMEPLFGFVPELSTRNCYDVTAARLFLELLSSRGAQWTVSEWQRGGLEPLFRRPAPPPAPEVVLVDTGREALREIHASRWWKVANAYWRARRRLRGAFGLGEPG